MSVVGAIRGVLITDSELAALLATRDGTPAVFGTWVSPDQGQARPYISTRFVDFRGSHFARRRGPLDLDIFTDGPGTMSARQIKDRLIAVLDRTIISDGADLLRTYLNTFGEIPTDIPDITRYNVQFEVHYWRQAFVEELVARE